MKTILTEGEKKILLSTAEGYINKSHREKQEKVSDLNTDNLDKFINDNWLVGDEYDD